MALSFIYSFLFILLPAVSAGSAHHRATEQQMKK